MANNYEVDKEWQDKRLKILKRDNYTCQNCKTFNPSVGRVEIYHPDDLSLELHEYDNNTFVNVYKIDAQRNGITLEMLFGCDYLVMPVLQVHHKFYIDNRKLWEYEDSDLITLCKECHSYLHDNNEIPFYDSLGKLRNKMKIIPNDFGTGHSHNFKNWIFIHKEGHENPEYHISRVKPELRVTIFNEDSQKIYDLEEEVNLMVKDFFARFLPDYSPE